LLGLDDGAGWIENSASGGARALSLRELVERRELVWFLAGRDLKVRYKQALLGASWSIVQPVVGALALTVVFHRVADVGSDGVPYVPFAMLGFAVWTLFARSVTAATASLVANTALITKVYFPRLLLPLAAVAPNLVDAAVALLPVAVAMAITATSPSAAIVTLPLWIVAVAVAGLGLGLVFATLNVRFRDAGAVIGLLVQLLFFLSPVAYPASAIEGAAEWAYYCNPMAGLIGGARWSMLGTTWPGWPIVVSFASTAILLVIGPLVFRRGERRFADVI
jgi:ABC-type polysaccharide/polyol phosphate export permease